MHKPTINDRLTLVYLGNGLMFLVHSSACSVGHQFCSIEIHSKAVDIHRLPYIFVSYVCVSLSFSHLNRILNQSDQITHFYANFVGEIWWISNFSMYIDFESSLFHCYWQLLHWQWTPNFVAVVCLRTTLHACSNYFRFFGLVVQILF